MKLPERIEQGALGLESLEGPSVWRLCRLCHKHVPASAPYYKAKRLQRVVTLC